MTDLTVLEKAGSSDVVKLVAKQKPLTAAEVKDQAKLIGEVLLSVMIKDVHFGTIPGTQKPSLLKPGAEKILTTFRIACVPDIEDLSTDDAIRYRVHAKGIHMPSGTLVGVGVGECSSDEDKYCWRAVVCPEEWETTDEGKRRVKWSKGWGDKPPYSVQQVRTNPADIANTVLKMAKKRALVDLTLTATAASDVFDQDTDDLPPEMVQQHQKRQKQHQSKPRMASGNANKPASEQQCKMLRARLSATQKEETWLCGEFNVDQLEDLTHGQVQEAVKKLQN